MSTRHLAAGLAAALAVVGVSSLARPQPPAERVAAPAGAAGPSALAGTASCSARGCHGAVGPTEGDGPRLNEYTVWITRDPHTHAYEVLRGDRAKQMAKNLDAADPKGGHIPATRDRLCLACHTDPLAAGSADEKLRAQGIGCETCHGPAQGDKPWLELHTTKTWRNMKDKAAYGMTSLDGPAAMARVCAGCHVGAPAGEGRLARDLNHDLYAAGHPRLQFELATYHANLPAHWRPGKPGSEARLWAVGQVVSARASLDLLLDRVPKKNSPERPWPEFAEYSCFACHNEIRGTDWRRPPNLGKRKPGSWPYATWYSSLLPVLAPQDAAIPRTFDELGLALSRPVPDEKAVTPLAQKAVGQLNALLPTVGKSPPSRAAVQSLLKDLAERARRSPPRNWDEREQFALAVAALAQADRSLARAAGEKPLLGPEVDERLRALFGALAYPDLPPPNRAEGPARFRNDPEAEKQMNELLKVLPAGTAPGR